VSLVDRDGEALGFGTAANRGDVLLQLLADEVPEESDPFEW
jgi:hypothetical protein